LGCVQYRAMAGYFLPDIHMNHGAGIAIHGGASDVTDITRYKEKEIREALQEALEAGYSVLSKNRSAISAVEAAIIVLEDSPYFNAGKGSNLSEKGTVEMHAAIMDGQTLNSGAVSAIKLVKNPIALARKVMDESKNIFLCSEGAMVFAKEQKLEFREENYFVTRHKLKEWEMLKPSAELKGHGTVGAVALDSKGNLAAATSTGGLMNAMCHRISDSAITGAGTYANNLTCALSCTGNGEFFIRTVLSKTISDLMQYKGFGLKESILEGIDIVRSRFASDVGIIGIDREGKIEMAFRAEKMYRAWKSVNNSGIEIY